jgi:S1-C subfamily serine protease
MNLKVPPLALFCAAALLIVVTGCAQSEADVAARVRASVVRVRTLDFSAKSGSGVIVEQGILTNRHVVEYARRIRIITNDGQQAMAVLDRSDPDLDLALLRATVSAPKLELDTARTQKQGDPVLVLGYPRPDAVGAEEATLTRGIISALRRNESGVTYIQTDAAINPGNSGGALINMQGRLIGLPTYKVSSSEGLNLAVDSDTLARFLATAMRPAMFSGDPLTIAVTQNDIDFWSGVQRKSERRPNPDTYVVTY